VADVVRAIGGRSPARGSARSKYLRFM
jgi:hypothetical protein